MKMKPSLREYFSRMDNPLIHLMVVFNFALVMLAWFVLLSQHTTVSDATADTIGMLSNAIMVLVMFDLVGKPALTMAIDSYRGELDV